MEFFTVKKWLKVFWAIFAFSCLNLYAQVDTEDISSVNITTTGVTDSEAPAGPYLIKGYIDVIGRAKFRKCNDLPRLKFSTGQAEFNFVYYYNACYKEALSITGIYDRTRLDWTLNPYFNQKDFDNFSILFNGYTERLDNWQWRSQISINFVNLEYWDYQDYMTYDFILWGRYTYPCWETLGKIGVHIGFLAQTGMKIDRVYPIIGFDWEYNDQWKLNAVYPVNIALIYTIDQNWSVDLAARFFDQRNRLRKKEFLSEGVWHYQTTGGEFGINYTPTKWITANVHAGINFGGHLTVASRHYRHRHRLRLDSAPYAGAEIDINF
jgi:hypothetical protein